MGPRDRLDLLHPWHEANFPHRGTHYATIEGAYQAWRLGRHRAGFAELSGGQAWALGARLGGPHRVEPLRTAVCSKFAGHEPFREAVLTRPPRLVWHQEPIIARRLDFILDELGRGRVQHQVSLDALQGP